MERKQYITWFALTLLVAALVALHISRRVSESTLAAVKQENKRNRQSIINLVEGIKLNAEVGTYRVSGETASRPTPTADSEHDGIAD